MKHDRPKMVWVPDDDWTTDVYILDGHGCRAGATQGRSACGHPAVAALRRGDSGWWCYCADHLYGRIVIGRTVKKLVRADSPAARAAGVEG